ncbi:hypothetical protein NK553_24130 [Pseudomonas sp. ZM23]|uniref:Uncharacterized protein n=1 Tax=Pseudomonas triclosanedens TaxID=2961893 RepID=A0ABY6ZRT8_9PSED|nr:hypothetical protein [Pseudomonas triclosanedens]MCP8467045.1 hypothetical protein [Pseudomonas triclosanedens]MCP8472807.1 hypothetical protein [Pseudomonas triclosanedens]MCP8478238.1 hypothetical protein [Pseudomonas triclosanedens]WAI47644.1 hypothetical protein OU419_17880 [Pseudomonas triclosanedens]
MFITDTRTLRTVRSASFNNDIVIELLQEITPLIENLDLSRRLRCAVRQLKRDADSLEDVWLELAYNRSDANSQRQR